MYIDDRRSLKQKAESLIKSFFDVFSESIEPSCDVISTEEFNKFKITLTEILKELFAEPIWKGDNEFDSVDILIMLVPIFNTLKCNVNTFIPQNNVDDFLKEIIMLREIGMYRNFTKAAKDIITISPNVVTKLKETKKEMSKIIAMFKKEIKESLKRPGIHKNHKKQYFVYASNFSRVSLNFSMNNGEVASAILTWSVKDYHKTTIDVTESFRNLH